MKGFKKFQELLGIDHFRTMRKFDGKSAGKVNRIAARMKFVLSFEEISTNNYTAETMAGYNGMFKTFLTYSAFEGFLQLFNTQFHEVDTAFTDYSYEEISKKIITLDKGKKFLDSIHSQLTSERLQVRLKQFQDEEIMNPIVLATSIRHTFAHGKLTPNTKKVKPKVVAEICELLSDLMIEIMDTEFERKIDSIYDEIKSKAKKEKTK